MNTIKSSEQIVRDEAHLRAQEVIRQFRTAIRPIYRSDPHRSFVHVGTCTLIRVGGEKFIVTAAHIIDQHENDLWIGGEKTAVSLTGMFRSTIAPEGNRELDNYDFSVSPVTPELENELGNATYISREFFGMGRRMDRTHSMYTCVGYPNSQNKDLYVAKREMNVRLWMHVSPGRSNDDRPGNWAKQTQDHLFIDFPKRVNTVDGGKRDSTKPTGSSGGPVFYLGDFGDPEAYRANGSFQPILEGIVIARPGGSNVLVAVKIGAILKALQSAGKLTD